MPRDREERAALRRAKAEAETRAVIEASNALTQQEEKAIVAEAWDRATNPEVREALVASRGPVPIKPTGPGRSRGIKLFAADGSTVNEVGHDRVLEALIRREGVEGAVVEGRKTSRRCCACGLPILRGARGRAGGCVGCRSELRRHAFTLRAEGHLMSQIAKALGLGLGTVHRMLGNGKSAATPLSAPGRPAHGYIKRQLVVERGLLGDTRDQIAAALGVSKSWVYTVLRAEFWPEEDQ